MPRKGGGGGKYRSIKTGRYISAYYGKRNPTRAVKERNGRIGQEEYWDVPPWVRPRTQERTEGRTQEPSEPQTTPESESQKA